LMAIVLPNLPGSIASPHTLGVSIAKLVVMFYALETLTAGVTQRAYWPTVTALAGLTLFSLRCL